jgi:hypothetical protein
MGSVSCNKSNAESVWFSRTGLKLSGLDLSILTFKTDRLKPALLGRIALLLAWTYNCEFRRASLRALGELARGC